METETKCDKAKSKTERTRAIAHAAVILGLAALGVGAYHLGAAELGSALVGGAIGYSAQRRAAATSGA